MSVIHPTGNEDFFKKQSEVYMARKWIIFGFVSVLEKLRLVSINTLMDLY
jgi:hypothetical protein